MLIPLKDIISIYEKIIKEINISDLSVIIFTGVDIDSLCTLKMLSKFLKSDSIQFKALPVTNYSELQQKIEECKGYERVRLFIFINCGGFIDLTQKWFVNNEQSNIFLFDVNKPINHENIQHPKIMVIDDQHSEFQNRLTSQDIKKLQQLQDLDIDQLQVEDQEEDGDENGSSPKRNNRRQMHLKLKKHQKLLQNKVLDYYGKTFFSLPSSYCLYKMVSYLHKANNYYLWLAIVSLTSMYLQSNITKEQLDFISNFYKSQMIRFNQSTLQKKQKGQIFVKMSYQFILMSHWSLYESMIYSPYLMVKLSLWNDKGVYKMQQFLTNIGISITEAKSLFKFMSKQSKDALEQNIFKCSDNYKLHEIMFQSFMKQTDYSASYMASDFHYILTAILQKSMSNGNLQHLSQHRIECFWNAYGIIDGSQEMLKAAVEQCKNMYKSIMKEVRDIVQRDNIMGLSNISFANIRCDTKEKRKFQHPYTLIRLAYILLGIQKQKRKNIKKQKKQKKRPIRSFIVSLHDIETNLCTLVGVMNQHKNNLGKCFNQAATNLKLQVRHDNFMANIMIISKQNLLQFIKQLDKSKY